MNKKQAYTLIKHQYQNYDPETTVLPLCQYIKDTKLRLRWTNYWVKIDTQKHNIIRKAFSKDENTECSLTRLLMLHCFIEDIYKD